MAKESFKKIHICIESESRPYKDSKKCLKLIFDEN